MIHSSCVGASASAGSLRSKWCPMSHRQAGDAAKNDAAAGDAVAAERPALKRLRIENAPMVTSGSEPQGLAEFSRMLSVFTHFGSLQVRS